MIAIWNAEQGAREATDGMTPTGWTGNFWGPDAARARVARQLPPLPTNGLMSNWSGWGRSVLRDGDILFRLGDARIARGMFPLSLFISRATRSPFSHTGIVAVEDGAPVVYDCTSIGVRRQPFKVWMLDTVGAWGVKVLEPEHRRHISGVLSYCRQEFEQQVPFDFRFRLDDGALYCLEPTEKTFRSQGLALSQPVPTGDWENLTSYPLTAIAVLYGTALVLDQPITLDQLVYLPGNERHGMWASPFLEMVFFASQPRRDAAAAPRQAEGRSLPGDIDMLVFVAGELRHSYAELPLRWPFRLDLARAG